MTHQKELLVRDRSTIDKIIESARNQEGPQALPTARKVSELGYLMIGTSVERENIPTVFEPHSSVKYDNGWKPRERNGIVATHLPALAVTSAALGDPNEVLQRVRAGRPLTEVNAAFGWKRHESNRGRFQPYMTLEAFDSLRKDGPNAVGYIAIVEPEGFEELPEEGLYFSDSAHERVGYFPVTGDDVTQMAKEYGVEIAPPVLI